MNYLKEEFKIIEFFSITGDTGYTSNKHHLFILTINYIKNFNIPRLKAED